MLNPCAKLNPYLDVTQGREKTIAAWRLTSTSEQRGVVSVLREDCYV